jgi:hypothetical protein
VELENTRKAGKQQKIWRTIAKVENSSKAAEQ